MSDEIRSMLMEVIHDGVWDYARTSPLAGDDPFLADKLAVDIIKALNITAHQGFHMCTPPCRVAGSDCPGPIAEVEEYHIGIRTILTEEEDHL